MMHRESERLYYRPLSFDILENIYHQFSDDEMCKYYSEPACTMDEAKEIIEHYSVSSGDSKPLSYFRAAMFDKVTEQFVGTVGYHFLDLSKKQVEIGYDVWKTFWGQGYGSEAVEMLINDCFNELAIDQIYALVHPENLASIGLLEKFEFVKCDPCRPFEEEPQICLKRIRDI